MPRRVMFGVIAARTCVRPLASAVAWPMVATVHPQAWKEERERETPQGVPKEIGGE